MRGETCEDYNLCCSASNTYETSCLVPVRTDMRSTALVLDFIEILE